MLRGGITGVALSVALSACGSNDDVPPEIVSAKPSEGADIWLHDPFAVTFSEAIDPETVNPASISLVDGEGSQLIGEVSLDADGTTARILAAEGAGAIGEVSLEVSEQVTDLAGNPLAARTFSWLVSPWTTADVDLVGAQFPVVGAAGDDVATVWSIVAGDSARIVVTDGAGRRLGGDLASGSVGFPALVGDASGRLVAAWSDLDSATVEAARWDGSDWVALASPGSGAFPVLASSPDGEMAIAWQDPAGDVDVARLADNQWQRPAGAPIDATQLGSRGWSLAVASDSQVIVALVDDIDIRVFRLGSSVVEEPRIRLTSAIGFNRVSVATLDGDVAIAWDDQSGQSFSAHVALQAVGGWTILPTLDIDAPSDAREPDVKLDADGSPVVAWQEVVDGEQRGHVARWNGSAWEPVGGDSWTRSTERSAVRPSMILWRERIPVVAWSDLGFGDPTGRIARFNGPRTPRLGLEARASIAGCSFDGSQATLSATGCFTIAGGVATPHPGLVPYDLISELWSDGAFKRRWFALPDGASLTPLGNGSLDAPEGSVVIKEFSTRNAASGSELLSRRQIMETRFLRRTAAGWEGVSYQWRADGSDADLLAGAAPTTVAWPLPGGATHTHSYPSRAECSRCHTPTAGPLLGVRQSQLARRVDYGGVVDDQLRTLEQVGLVTPLASTESFAAPHDPRETLERRVRSYLAVNCAHCHDPAGEQPARDFRAQTSLADSQLCGVVTPGNPTTSTVFIRVSTRPGMPPLATLQTDPVIVNVMSSWISSIATCP